MRQILLACSLIPVVASAQQTVTIQVDAASKSSDFKPSWAYFGYDEPNFTYAKNGQKLIGELVHLSGAPVHIRTHFLLTTGDGRAALKWGSTNAYTEDASGKAVYDWTLVDKILSTFVDAGAIPFVEIGFMPKALSTHPDPYTPNWVPGAKNEGYSIGWTYPPKDYEKWSELIYQWVSHSVEKYGKSAVESWDWEVWNEPNISYWHGTPEEYDKLYDYTAAAVKRALPTARIGGPASTGPDSAKAAEFLRQFLEHCASGKNYATGQTGTPLDFISYHVKGRPQVVGDHVRMGLSQEMKDVSRGFEIVKSFPKFSGLPIVLSEADPEGCAACSARVYPQNAYRNGTLYPAYEAAALKTMLTLERRDKTNLQGILTWAFEFEDQPYFDGFRTLATNGIDKPVLNFFRMTGLMTGSLVTAESSAAVAPEAIVAKGVAERPTVDGLATRSAHSVAVLVWNYQDEDVTGPAADVALKIAGLPAEAKRVQVKQYRIDQEHSNAYTAWKQMGSPQNPTAGQYRSLEAAGQLQLLNSPCWLGSSDGNVDMKFSLPLQALSLVELSW
jgi:xylan 1,4-beta-xylosidase